MIQLMESDISNQRFIISAENKSYRQIFNLIADSFGKKHPHKKITHSLSQLVWRLEAIKNLFNSNEPLVTKETAQTALAKKYFDNSKLKKFLPSFQYKTIEENNPLYLQSITTKA